MSTTKLNNLINPQVMASFIDAKLVDAIKLAPLAEVGHDLHGVPGNTLTFPVFAYIGDAEDLAEGAEGSISQLTASTTQVTVKKAVKNVELTDEAVLSGLGDPVGQTEKQLLVSLASKVDNDCLEAIRDVSTLTHTGVFGKDYVADALVKFGEDMDETTFIFINAKNYSTLRKAEEYVHIANGQAIINGQIGTIFGCPVVVSNKINDTECFFVRRGALGIEVKREVTVETDRNVLAKKTLISADSHYVAYVKDASKVIKGTISPAVLQAKAKAGK